MVSTMAHMQFCVCEKSLAEMTPGPLNVLKLGICNPIARLREASSATNREVRPASRRLDIHILTYDLLAPVEARKLGDERPPTPNILEKQKHRQDVFYLHLPTFGLLGGPRLLISRLLSTLAVLITIATPLKAPAVTTPEPPSTRSSLSLLVPTRTPKVCKIVAQSHYE